MLTMNKKLLRSLLCILLLLALVGSFLLPALAKEPDKKEEEEAPGRVLTIRSEEQFLKFAENCRLDSFSKNLTVQLEADLDLTGLEFEPIPIFYGIFEGNSHIIQGLELKTEGSVTGLFRYLEPDSQVRNLLVLGSILPQGSRGQAGGIAGRNAGTLQSCRFEGEVSGADTAGGIVGVNAVTGVLDNCMTQGNVHGDHFVGGIAGENYGVLRDCHNHATVNTSAQENTVEIDRINLNTITGTESVNTVTDVGGIAGTSAGVIRDCINRGDVGYRHMGYNIGGIAGSQSGFLTGCANYGRISGRKDVGGIVGQLEPQSQIEYTVDTLQILKKQLAATSSLVGRASSHARGSAASMGSDLAYMQDLSQTARESLDMLLPGGQHEMPHDSDEFIAAHNALTGSLREMRHTASRLGENVQDSASQIAGDLSAISGQMHTMGQTIDKASENLGGKVEDVSDLDTPDDTQAKVVLCKNYAPVSGDLNTGGVVGAMAFERDFDPEDDLQVLGDPSLNFNSKIRAVVHSCENRGTVSGKKSAVGGIAGWVSMGLVKDCINTGHLDAGSADYVGGIAGSSAGFLRSCSTKSLLNGSTYVGGIAGLGTIATDCLSMVEIREGSERTGAVFGMYQDPRDEEIPDPVKNNRYLNLSDDPGAIDGISYEGIAAPESLTRFLAREDLPLAFQKATVTFRFEDGTQTHLVLPIGTALRPDQIPELPKKDHCHGIWEASEDTDTDKVYFDICFEARYEPHRMTVQSPQTRPDNRSILLAEGKFPSMEQIRMEPLTELPVPGSGTALEGWQIPAFTSEGPTMLHYCLSPEADPEHQTVLIRHADGTWTEAEHTTEGSYLVFPVAPDDDAICLVQLPDYGWIRYGILSAAVLALLIPIAVIRRKKKKKK